MDAFEKTRLLVEEVNRGRTKLILTEIHKAKALLSVADTTPMPETRRRTLENARKSYQAIAAALAEGVSCSELDLQSMEQGLADIGEGLRRHGALPE